MTAPSRWTSANSSNDLTRLNRVTTSQCEFGKLRSKIKSTLLRFRFAVFGSSLSFPKLFQMVCDNLVGLPTILGV